MHLGNVKESSLLSLAVSVGLFLGIGVGGGLLYLFKAPSSRSKDATETASQNPSSQATGGGSNPGINGAGTAPVASGANDTGTSQSGDTDNLSEEQKKKINVFGYDTERRTALAGNPYREQRFEV